MSPSSVLHRPRVLFGSMMGWRQALGDRLRAQGCEIVDVDGGDREQLEAAQFVRDYDEDALRRCLINLLPEFSTRETVEDADVVPIVRSQA